MSAPQPHVRVTLVTAPGCHFCDDAHQHLVDLICQGVPIELDVVDVSSAAGARLLFAHRPAMNPLVLVDDAYFSAGRFPRRKFRALLDTRGEMRDRQAVRHG